MNAALSVAGGWIVALAIAVPFVVLFWWARRNEPLTREEVDYSVGRRTAPPAEPAGHLAAPMSAAAVEAPVMSNPAALAPPAESVVPPASTVMLPENAPLPPEPPGVVTTAAAPTLAPEPQPAAPTLAASAPAPVSVATPAVSQAAPVTPKVEPPAPTAPFVPADGPTPPAAKAAEPAPKPPAPANAPAAPAPVAAKPKPAPAPAPTPPTPPPASVAEQVVPPAPKPVAPEPEPEPVATPEPAVAETAPAAAAEPPAETDDFTRLYGLDASAIAALQGAGIYTYRELAAANVANLREILAAAGQPDADPTMWPQQGRFASNGKWKQLEARFKPK